MADFSKPYNPKETEEKIYKLWEESGFFNPDNLPTIKKSKSSKLKAKNYCIVMPPPNVTGSLHMGHALNSVIQDILIRKKRMEGFWTLWLPGTDHAGIATQNVVEKDLKKQNISRHHLGKEKFLEKIWEWKEKYGNIILDQLKKIGSSMDWSRTRFTMDAGYQEAVKTAFLHYYKKGLIYRAERVVNWCFRCATSLSDLELEYKEEKDKLYYIKYPLKVQSLKLKAQSYITVATTRPETMLGDTAVVVNPKDERYKNLIGMKVILPIQNREIPVIADRAIDQTFGTGAVKVTPAHDILDSEIGSRHNLPIVKVIGQNGRMTIEAGQVYEGLKIKECREKIVAVLKERGLLEKEEDYSHNVAVCYRCGTIIEPIPSFQWFLKMGNLAKMAIKAVKSGKIKFHPKRWEKVYFNWLKNIKDWCISRQIWWGHKVPLEKCAGCDEYIIEPKIKSKWFIVRHGETDWNKEDRWMGQKNISLNENGTTQAKEAAKKLEGENIDLIISSDLERCRQTAEIISKHLNVGLIFDERLRERTTGEWEGFTSDEIKKNFSIKNWERRTQYEYKPGGGESWKDLEERILPAFHDHKINHHHRNIVIVTHVGPIKIIKKNLKKLLWEQSNVGEVKNAEITKLLISENKCKKCKGDILEPVDDVLDTWFSSALWPFAVFNWPKKTQDLRNFYPTNTLSTARDIINLWVARMIFSGIEFMDKEPFKDVIIHATILAKDGRRMSKSLGTGIDPIDLINQFGADATRFGLIWQAMGGQDIHWAEESVVAGKKFCNKIWNASRFVLEQIGNSKFQIPNSKQIKNFKFQTKADQKIISQLKKMKKQIEKDLDKYQFGQALRRFYDFFWHDFCDQYIEASKLQIVDDKLAETTKKILLYTLIESLKILHPFMPFITEEIWQNLSTRELVRTERGTAREKNKILMVEKW